MNKFSRIREFKRGPLNGHETEIYASYIDAEGKKVNNTKGDNIRRSGKGGLYYLRGNYYEWNDRA